MIIINEHKRSNLIDETNELQIKKTKRNTRNNKIGQKNRIRN